MLYQGLCFEVVLHLLTWIGSGGSADELLGVCLLMLGDMEDIMDIFESPPEIQSASCLPDSLYHPERSNKPSPKLPSTMPGEVVFEESKALFLPSDVSYNW